MKEEKDITCGIFLMILTRNSELSWPGFLAGFLINHYLLKPVSESTHSDSFSVLLSCALLTPTRFLGNHHILKRQALGRHCKGTCHCFSRVEQAVLLCVRVVQAACQNQWHVADSRIYLFTLYVKLKSPS